NVVAERRRVTERLARIARDHVEPGERAAREVLGLEIIDGYLQRDRREQAADEAHVVVPGQPGDAAIGILDLEAEAVRVQIVEQCAMSDGDAMREARRAARILQV